MRRFDLDGDAKLTFAEFAEALTPVQPSLILNPFRRARPIPPEIIQQQQEQREQHEEQDFKRETIDNLSQGLEEDDEPEPLPELV